MILNLIVCPGLDSDWAYISLRYEDRASKKCRTLLLPQYKYTNSHQKLQMRVS
jgi:hypothetical protein